MQEDFFMSLLHKTPRARYLIRLCPLSTSSVRTVDQVGKIFVRLNLLFKSVVLKKKIIFEFQSKKKALKLFEFREQFLIRIFFDKIDKFQKSDESIGKAFIPRVKLKSKSFFIHFRNKIPNFVQVLVDELNSI